MKNLLRNFVRTVISIVLTQESGNTIHAALFKFKNKNKWLFRLVYGTANDEEIFNNIVEKLDKKFDILMIHSSFDGMMPMYNGNPSKLLSLIIAYCKQNNITLAMPTFFGGSNLQAKEYYEKGDKIFNVKKTASQIGLLTELFRITQNVKRSVHPTHSICALGPLAEKLTANHHLAETIFGEGTPFGEMNNHRTIILGIGTKNISQIHSAEEILKDHFPLKLYSNTTIPITCFDESGESLTYNFKIRNPEYVIGTKSFYRILKNVITNWSFKGISFYITNAKIITDTLIEAAQNGRTLYKKKNNL